MKKFFVALTVLLVLFSANICAAYVYDDDSDYVYLGTYGSGGYSTYLYLPSVDVQEYNPPHYQIAGNFVTIGGRYEISESWLIQVVRFNWYTKETFNQNSDKRWQKENIGDIYFRKRADLLFNAAYGIDFYGY